MLWRIYDLASKSQKMWQRWKAVSVFPRLLTITEKHHLPIAPTEPEPVINENWSLLTPLQQQYHWCRQHFSCKMTIQSMFFSINDKQPFRPTLVALKLMGKMTSKCLPFFQYFMPFHYCKTIKDSIQLNFCNLTKGRKLAHEKWFFNEIKGWEWVLVHCTSEQKEKPNFFAPKLQEKNRSVEQAAFLALKLLQCLLLQLIFFKLLALLKNSLVKKKKEQRL